MMSISRSLSCDWTCASRERVQYSSNSGEDSSLALMAEVKVSRRAGISCEGTPQRARRDENCGWVDQRDTFDSKKEVALSGSMGGQVFRCICGGCHPGRDQGVRWFDPDPPTLVLFFVLLLLLILYLLPLYHAPMFLIFLYCKPTLVMP